DQRYRRLGRLEDRVGGEGGRDEDDAGVRPRLGDGGRDGVEDGDPVVPLPALSGGDPGDDVRAVLDRLLGVERPLLTGQALAEQGGPRPDENGHHALPAAATAFSAASRIPSATTKARPEDLRISRPCSTLVPSSLTTTGTLTPTSFAAATTPSATTSQ